MHYLLSLCANGRVPRIHDWRTSRFFNLRPLGLLAASSNSLMHYLLTVLLGDLCPFLMNFLDPVMNNTYH